MKTIEFYYMGEFLAECPLPEGTMSKDRIAIANSVGIKKYDRMRFMSNGKCRMDTDDLKDKSHLKHELSE